MKFRTVVEKRGYLWVLPLLLPLLHHSPFRRSPPWNNTVETNSFRSFCARLLHPRVRASKHLKTTRSNVTSIASQTLVRGVRYVCVWVFFFLVFFLCFLFSFHFPAKIHLSFAVNWTNRREWRSRIDDICPNVNSLQS